MPDSPIVPLGQLGEWTDERLRETSSRDFVLEVPTWAVGRSRHYVDAADDYAWALYAAEALRPYGAVPPAALGEVPNDAYAGPRGDTVIRFRVQRPQAGVDAALRELDPYFSESDEHAEARFLKYGDVLDLVEPLALGADPPPIHFHRLADRFMANAVAGMDGHGVPIPLGASPRPEWAFGFWRSAEARSCGLRVYVSDRSWIVPRDSVDSDVGFDAALARLGGFADAPDFRPARAVRDAGVGYLVHGSTVVEMPRTDTVLEAVECAGVIFETGPPPYVAAPDHAVWHLSTEGEVAYMDEGRARHVFFPRPLDHVAVGDLYGSLTALAGLVGEAGNLAPGDDLDLPWGSLDAERFERLCYDVLTTSERYDPEGIRKMGKSSSRDGKRDLIAHTRWRIGEPQKRIVVQCKFGTTARSLGAGGLDIVDTVEQDGADGYCVMTNLVVDATLYDQLRMIGERRGWHTDVWSRFEIERALRRRPDVRARYF